MRDTINRSILALFLLAVFAASGIHAAAPTATPTYTRIVRNTWTPTKTFTKTATPTATKTRTPTWTHTATHTHTATATVTRTGTNTPTSTPTSTVTNTPTNSPTSTRTNTPTNSPTNTPTNTPTVTPTVTRTNTPTNTPTSAPNILALYSGALTIGTGNGTTLVGPYVFTFPNGWSFSKVTVQARILSGSLSGGNTTAYIAPAAGGLYTPSAAGAFPSNQNIIRTLCNEVLGATGYSPCMSVSMDTSAMTMGNPSTVVYSFFAWR